MRRTRLGVLILAAGWSCFPIALVAHSVAPAILGVLLIATTLLARLEPPLVAVERRMPDEAVEGEPFEVLIEATDPAHPPMFVEQDLPPGIELIEARAEPGRGRARLTLRVRARSPGIASWERTRVRVQDAWGVVEEEVVVPIEHHLRVLPDSSGIAAGRDAARRGQIGVQARRRLEADWEPEIERLREHQPGDRLRDIDWAHSTQLGRLITRELSRQSMMPVVVLVQAGASMRLERRHAKLDTAVQAALGIMSAAQAVGLPTGLVAFDDRGVRAQVRISSSREVLALALKRLSEMPENTTQLEVVADPREPVEFTPPTPEERAFLEAVALFDPLAPRGLTPLEAALGAVGRVTAQPALVVALLDVEEAPALAKVVAPRLAKRGHRPVIVGLASGAHHYSLREVDDRVLESLIVWRRNREQARVWCREMRVPMTMVGPELTAEVLRSVIKSAR